MAAAEAAGAGWMTMAAKYIIAALSVLFLVLGVTSIARAGGKPASQGRTWILIAVIFGVVSAWLFTRT
jgi:uncharacterized membrane protein HdeD (DUF308 family)